MPNPSPVRKRAPPISKRKVMATILGAGIVLSALMNCVLRGSTTPSFDFAWSTRPRCNRTLQTLSSLGESFEYVRGDYVICVDLQPGTEYLSYTYHPIDVDAVSVIITGSTGAVVRCNETRQFIAMNDSTIFPMIFSNASLVVIERVQFEGCQRPIRFNWITRVEIVSSNFR